MKADHIKEIMKENIPALIQENQNLKAELDKAIHKLSDYEKALKIYATGKFDPNRFEPGDYAYATDIRALDNGDLAKETLKKWENK